MQKSTVGGILSIVAGALGLIGGLIILMLTLFMSSAFNDPAIFGDFSTTDGQFLTIFSVIYGGMAIFGLIVGALGIVGGIFSLQRKHWGWALAGAIVGCLSFLPLGVASVVLVAMGKSEFNQSATSIASQPSGNVIA